jgi:5-methylcytosine-specific restriction endonuclease McrA
VSNPVLLLDAAWRVDRVIGVEYACELLLEAKAVAASDDIAKVMHSPSLTVEIPSVIARVGSLRGAGHRGVACSPRRVKLRDAHVCQFVVDGVPCDRRGDTVDHLVPRALAGVTSWHNCVGACRFHNGWKASTPIDEMRRRHGWELLREPFVPSRAALIVASVPHRPAWQPFLVA